MRPAPGPSGRTGFRRSLAGRVTLLTTMAVGLTVALVAAGAYLTMRLQLQDTLDESLLDRAQAAASADALQQLTVANDIPSWALGAGDIRIAFLTAGPEPEVVSADRDPDAARIALGAPETRVAVQGQGSSLRTVEAGGERFRVVAVPAQTRGQALVIAQSLDAQEKVMAKVGVVTLLLGLAGVVLAGFAGWGVARNGLKPVRRLTGAVETIARTEQLTPIPVEGDDEIARLSTSFNQMLAALEASRDRQRRLVADAGHELRTPLTSLRTNIDLLSQATAADDDPHALQLPPEARQELMDDVRAQTEELTTLIGDLVELARDEPLAHVVGTVDLAELVEHAVARVRRRAPAVRFEVDTEAWEVVGESGTLERAVTNLLDNAAKWSPDGGTVRVRLAEGVLSVDDEGPGIAEHDRPHVFERFYRADESRSMPGSGLGLAIVAQAAERHSGTVRAEASAYGGARLVLQVPGSPPGARDL
ncbi:HAMP domain-containing sensor histidine kinase [Nocardioides sp. SOB44]|jgi:two-component system sensor histidine kinase MprB|uniref:histidine kinase n=1 Tax=Nocardioides cremeus TaxID=3058044 RepID=A0ABT8TJT6_9ACTN|nr:HAMP domain-containing sensor histidine kinase [Nocardioides cremeus]MDO3394222.1 HAMP domain-containing sensor histidine kinase [Nocardioides cremeus]